MFDDFSSSFPGAPGAAPVFEYANATSVPAEPKSLPAKNHCENIDIPLQLSPPASASKKGQEEAPGFFNTSFFIYIANEKEEGLYSLYFHNCHNYQGGSSDKVLASFVIDIEEKNNDSYLSAGGLRFAEKKRKNNTNGKNTVWNGNIFIWKYFYNFNFYINNFRRNAPSRLIPLDVRALFPLGMFLGLHPAEERH